MTQETWTLPKIVEQLEWCGYWCKGGPLEKNVAFMALKVMAGAIRICVYCGNPIEGIMIGAGDGSGQQFAHINCWEGVNDPRHQKDEGDAKIRYCCFIGCPRLAEWAIIHGPTTDDYTEACTRHVGELLTDAKEHRVYNIGGES